MVPPGVPVDRVLRKVREEVVRLAKSVGHEQVPALYDQALGEFYFRAGTDVQSLPAAYSPPAAVPTAAQIEEELWDSIRDHRELAVFEEYLAQYPKGRHAGHARVNIAKLKAEARKLASASAPEPAPVAASGREDAETGLWKAVDNGNVRDDYDVYLSQYPKGKYVALAKARQRKLDGLAQQEARRKQDEALQAEQDAWNAAERAFTPDAFLDDQKRYPRGRYAALVAGRLKKVEADITRTGRVFKDCPDCAEMVVIPPGSFQMGSDDFDSEKPAHTVTIGKAFALGKTEVTQGQWRSIMGSNPSRFKGCGDKCPVENVSWDDIREFLAKLNARAGKAYRLPSEAEWEYAVRAGTTTKYSWGDEIGRNNANCDGCGSQWDNKSTALAGSFRANAFGLHDMYGNVWEWVEDCWNASYSGAPTDASAWTTGNCSLRVVRGGLGATSRGFCGRTLATGTPPAYGSLTTVSVLPGRFSSP